MVNQVREKNSNFRKDKHNKKGFMNQLTVEELIKAGAVIPAKLCNPPSKIGL